MLTYIQEQITDFENFFFETGEDYILWDEQEQGKYPPERMIKAMSNKLKDMKSNLEKPFADTESDGIVFCGKCGKQK